MVSAKDSSILSAMGPYTTLLARAASPGIMVASFNRSEAANAINTQMALDLKDIFCSLPPSCRAVIVTGEGKHFCAGADLKERKEMDETRWRKQHAAFREALQVLLECPVPVVAAVNGAAFGGGLELALACDFIYATDTARFALTEVTLGIMPGLGGTQTLPRAAGMRWASELIFTGRAFSAQEALQWGVVNKLCAPETLLDEAIACVTVIAANAPLSIKAVKQAMRQGIALPLPQALQCELTQYNTLLPSKDRHEGIDAFNAKRKPVFSGE